MGMLVGVSAGTSGAFTQGFCVGESSPECPREGLGEQPCTPIEAVTPDLLHQGSTRSHQPLQVLGVVPWGPGQRVLQTPPWVRVCWLPWVFWLWGCPGSLWGSSPKDAAVPTRSVPGLSVSYG